ncbi:hypothetical protein GQ53DRAFT_336302 [Thozetella sp. PMI_491]|nr:hypothetical protein GQ53DRAFT_336302 [Thozetella sp. PMI_491]
MISSTRHRLLALFSRFLYGLYGPAESENEDTILCRKGIGIRKRWLTHWFRTGGERAIQRGFGWPISKKAVLVYEVVFALRSSPPRAERLWLTCTPTSSALHGSTWRRQDASALIEGT